jgi:hypothetical protein
MRSFLFTPIPYIILTPVIYLFISTCYGPIAYCEDGGYTLYNLKVNLTHEVTRFRMADVNFTYYSDLKEQLMSISKPNFRNFSLEQEDANNLENCRVEMRDSLNRARELENAIRMKEPKFKSAIVITNYLHVSKG